MPDLPIAETLGSGKRDATVAEDMHGRQPAHSRQFTEASLTQSWCPGWELNPHSRCREKDFKSFASASFATRAGCISSVVNRSSHRHFQCRDFSFRLLCGGGCSNSSAASRWPRSVKTIFFARKLTAALRKRGVKYAIGIPSNDGLER